MLDNTSLVKKDRRFSEPLHEGMETEKMNKGKQKKDKYLAKNP